MYKLLFKRAFDFFTALIALILLSPILILVIVLLYLKYRANPLFVQERTGKNEEIFRIFKLKTMSDEKDKFGNLLPDHKRLTPLGKVIRKLSIDELPQLVNVIKGEMSIIGPRPLLVEYLPFYNEIQKKRHSVRPGITGWAQVNGRNSITWDEKFELDVKYVNTISFTLDIKIFIMTIKKIFVAEDISAKDHATMPRFDEISKSK
ncbi:sugar transferase [Lacihabitans sp. CCS-44]|uniref:sugar transferase n=1 Tax=Lacihabitans sp. CCS-44 TaxID=2487331 RepID=UPI0020CD203F|nr:sugar transferase [Lacihabitans sp. CCS-44]MCP9754969.1 sugar transferase [Lacihabitans sp. CCS-44]